MGKISQVFAGNCDKKKIVSKFKNKIFLKN